MNPLAELKDQKLDWTKNEYHKTIDSMLPDVVDVLPRIDSRTLSPQEFRNKYELPRIPIILTHVMDDWPAMKKWTVKVRTSSSTQVASSWF